MIDAYETTTYTVVVAHIGLNLYSHKLQLQKQEIKKNKGKRFIVFLRPTFYSAGPQACHQLSPAPVCCPPASWSCKNGLGCITVGLTWISFLHDLQPLQTNGRCKNFSLSHDVSSVMLANILTQCSIAVLRVEVWGATYWCWSSFNRTESTDSPDCLPIFLSTSVFTFSFSFLHFLVVGFFTVD